MATKKKATKAPKELDTTSEFIVIGHLVKYNLYLLAKATVFAAIMAKSKDLHTALLDTEKAINELDLDTKSRKEQKDP